MTEKKEAREREENLNVRHKSLHSSKLEMNNNNDTDGILLTILFGK